MIGVDRASRRAWRPQEFGRRNARDVVDPLVEPLWTGLRVLAHVDDGRAAFIDRDGAEIDEPAVATALEDATLVRSAVLDGYLTADATRSSEGAFGEIGELPSPASQARQLFLGSRPERPELEALQLADREREGALPAGPLGFVAVDLVDLEDEPLLDIPLLERKRLLESIVSEGDLVRVGIHVRPPVATWVVTWRSLGFRGLVFKAANGRYTPGEANDSWSLAPMPTR